MKAIYKSELARLAGVSPRTFRRYLASKRAVFDEMGVSLMTQKLPPKAVKYICDEFCIDI